ncbi:MAG: hypothetical protein KC800_14775 [Candidatus Eremiobacteraeota bacterium]|nr:hypothetical protein [Candidatus Eremiobacteraeota bacterium]
MSCDRVVIASASLPHSIGEGSEPESTSYYHLLGPVINVSTLRLLEASILAAERVEVILAGYLLVQGYQILNRTNTYQTHDLYEYMKPLACSFTELTLNLEQIVRLPEDEELMDLVMETYISNLLADFQFFADQRLPDRDLTFRGFYLSRRLSRLVPCRPIERKLTPKFGTLAFAVTKNEIRTYIPSE